MSNKNKFLSDQHRKNNFVPKKKEDNKTRIAAWVLFILIAFCTVCSFLTIGMTLKDCRKVNAEDVRPVEWSTPPLLFSLATVPTFNFTVDGNTRTHSSFLSLASNYYTFSFGRRGASDLYSFCTYFDYSLTTGAFNRVSRSKEALFQAQDNVYYFDSFLTPNSTLYNFKEYGKPYLISDYVLDISSKFSGVVRYKGFTNDTSQISFTISSDFDFSTVYKLDFTSAPQTYGNWVVKTSYTFYDIKERILNIYAISYNYLNLDTFTYTYYFASDSQKYYQSGYDYGYEIGLGSANNDTYQNGFNIGKKQGYSQGYNAGVESANKYTFLSLISSVVDAPIKALSGLLNFNILGFNMLDFFYALITLAVIIAVLRLIL